MDSLSIGNWAQIGGNALGLFGNLQSARAARENAARRREAQEYEALQLEQNAGQVRAATQRQALEERRKATLVASRALAVAAAGGGGVSDPTVVRILSNIAGEGAYRSAVSIYDGEDRARLLKMKAAAARYEGEMALAGGEAAADAYALRGAGAALSGMGSIFSKYAGKGPSGDSALIDNTAVALRGDYSSLPAVW